jgi:hypothetical protein
MLEHDRRLARWFAEHDSIVTVVEAAALGVDHDALLRRHDAGLLVREHHGVYRDAAVAPTFATSIRAAIGAAGDGAFVAGHSLMRLFGVRGTWSTRPEIAVLGSGEHVRLDGVRVRRIDRVLPGDVHRRNGLPVLAPALGLLVLGASAPPWKVETAVHDMVYLGHTALPILLRTLKEYGASGRNGVTSFRDAVRTLDPAGRATQTNMELTLVRAIVDVPGIPEPHLQFLVVDGAGKKRKLDLAWPDHGLDVETDGDRWHLNPRDKVEMKRRDAALHEVGYDTWRFDSDEVATALPAIVARLRRFFGG